MKIPGKNQFQVIKSNFTKNNIQTIPDENLTLLEGEILVQVDLFSFTSNNITYAVSGDIIRYWEFFPAVNENIEEWGVIPVWGFADVVDSKTEEVPVGDRIFGYFPPATHLKMKADRITKKKFIDGSEHRSTLPPHFIIYTNEYFQNLIITEALIEIALCFTHSTSPLLAFGTHSKKTVGMAQNKL